MHLVVDGHLKGPFAIHNLSAGGLLAAADVGLRAGDSVRVFMTLSGRKIVLDACVVRAETEQIALWFRDIDADTEDLIQQLVLQSIEEARGPVVLVADESREARRLLARQLCRLGCRVKLATTPLDALTILQKMPVDVVIAELFFGSADGTALLELAQENRKNVRCVLMSGQVRPDQLRLALLLRKAHAVLPKPWTEQQLEAAVLPAPRSAVNG